MAICASLTSGSTIYFADPCKDNALARIEAYTENFFDRIGRIDSALLNLPNEINSVVELTGDVSNGFINSILGSLQDELAELIPEAIQSLEKILTGLGRTIPEIIAIETPLIPLVKTLFDGIFCASSKIMNSAKDALGDIFTAAAKNVLNGTACVAQEIVGALTNHITNQVDSIVSPLIEPIRKIFSAITGDLFNFDLKNFLVTGINLTRKIVNLFECDDEKICPASSKYVIDQGPLKDMSETDQSNAWDSIFSGVAISQGASNLATDFEKTYGKWSIFGDPIGDSSSLGPCEYGNVTTCGNPTVSFFGGDGIGGAGNVVLGQIVDNVDTEDAVGDVIKIGSIVGVDITDPGSGYTVAPVVTFQDSCNKGYGAYGHAVIDQVPTSPTFGQITSVVIISEGANYPANVDELPLYISDVIIENPGQGYNDGDGIDGLDIEVTNGRITRATVLPGLGYNGLPNLNIDSLTGFGAILRPVMTVATPQTEIVQVIDCIS